MKGGPFIVKFKERLINYFQQLSFIMDYRNTLNTSTFIMLTEITT